MRRNPVFTAAAAALAVAPLAVHAAPALRADAGVDQAEMLRGTTLWIVGAVGLALIIWGALEIFDDGTNSVPLSP
jgi:hypothetical protein